MSARIAAVNLLDIDEFLRDQPETTREAAKLAINGIATRKAVPQFRRAMRDEVNFPAGYLEDPDRFGVTRQATTTDLSATVTARFRPTSLARFAPGQSFEGAKRTGGVKVKVSKTGGGGTIPGAFFVRLRRGKDTTDGFNTGIAIRLKPGERLRGRRKGTTGIELAPNLYLLYGPSVDQVFREVSVAESPSVADQLQKEFLRQYVRLSGDR